MTQKTLYPCHNINKAAALVAAGAVLQLSETGAPFYDYDATQEHVIWYLHHPDYEALLGSYLRGEMVLNIRDYEAYRSLLRDHCETVKTEERKKANGGNPA